MDQFSYHRISTAPQVTPAPKADIRIKSPFLMRPLRTHSSRQMGMEAEEVLPTRLMLEYTLPAIHFQALPDGVSDALVGLVGNKQVQIPRSRTPAFVQHAPGDFLHAAHGHLEQLVPAHLDVVLARLAPSCARGRAVPPAGM